MPRAIASRASATLLSGTRTNSVKTVPGNLPRGLLLDKKFREGFAKLGSHGLSFDAWLFHHQIPDLTDLAKAFPGTTVRAQPYRRADRDECLCR